MGEEGRGDAAPPQNGGTQPGGIEPADPRGAGANLVGRLLGGVYRVDKLITGGAMGVVYLARQLSVDREVIVKTLRLSDSDTELNEILVRRFRREAVATAHLDHPNTVRLIDYGDDRGLQYLVLERLRGRSLATVLATEGPLPAREVARIGALICRSLAEAHAAGVIHRDLKPENVFLCDYPGEPDVVKVMDFGVARLMPHTDQHVSRITTAGLTVGTPMYIAPEQARGLETSPATDLYSLGVVLFELLVGRPPHQGATAPAPDRGAAAGPGPRLAGPRHLAARQGPRLAPGQRHRRRGPPRGAGHALSARAGSRVARHHTSASGDRDLRPGPDLRRGARRRDATPGPAGGDGPRLAVARRAARPPPGLNAPRPPPRAGGATQASPRGACTARTRSSGTPVRTAGCTAPRGCGWSPTRRPRSCAPAG